MDDPQVTTGSILQLRCSRCGALNMYRRKVVSVDFLNDARRRIERIEVMMHELLAELEEAEVDTTQLRKALGQ